MVLRAQEQQDGFIVLVGDEERLVFKNNLQFRLGRHRRDQKLLAGKGVGGIWIVQGGANGGSQFAHWFNEIIRLSAAEQARNEIVYSYQVNRNPFIDHPEWVAAAFIPPLTIARTGTNIVLGWTNDYAPTMVIEESTGPGSA